MHLKPSCFAETEKKRWKKINNWVKSISIFCLENFVLNLFVLVDSKLSLAYKPFGRFVIALSIWKMVCDLKCKKKNTVFLEHQLPFKLNKNQSVSIKWQPLLLFFLFKIYTMHKHCVASIPYVFHVGNNSLFRINFIYYNRSIVGIKKLVFSFSRRTNQFEKI